MALRSLTGWMPFPCGYRDRAPGMGRSLHVDVGATAQVVAANPPDFVLLEQNGEACVVSMATLLEPAQPRLTLASGVLLGRVSIGSGGPEPVGVGSHLAIQNGQLVLDANGLAPLERFPAER
jgi:hypothetical protein